MSDHGVRIRRTAKRVFGYESLREGQEEAIASLLDGQDTMVVMPTGAGKSAIYQIPALLIDGPTVVVSPLLALQKDQAERLAGGKFGGASVINSLVSHSNQEAALDEVVHGQAEFLFMAPEQFSNPERLAAVKAAKPSLFVVDEAHCVSEWGHSFRPDYLKLGKVIEELGHPTVLALTATANQEVRTEIALRLGMREPAIFVRGFDRPNIWLGVETASSETRKRALLLQRIKSSARPGIVYATTRKHAEEINDELNNVGISSALYHGGLNRKDRESMQEQFMEDRVDVIVATSAFGLGVDKPNVRFVFHYEPPDSLDSYYQEIGRAGRDGQPAWTVLFYHPNDLGVHKFFKGSGQICVDDVQKVLDLLADGEEVGSRDLQEKAGLSKVKLSRTLSRLEECGVLEVQSSGSIRSAGGDLTSPDVAEKASAAQTERHEAEIARIEEMRRYAEHLACRRAYLLTYFEETAALNCGNCDNCQGSGTERARLIAETNALAEAANQAGRSSIAEAATGSPVAQMPE